MMNMECTREVQIHSETHGRRHVANGGLNGGRRASTAVEDPLEHANVLAKAGPQELACQSDVVEIFLEFSGYNNTKNDLQWTSPSALTWNQLTLKILGSFMPSFCMDSQWPK